MANENRNKYRLNKRTAPAVAVIGSNARDLPEYLRETLDVCTRLGMIPVMVEHPAAGDRNAVDAALSLVDRADVYIGIFALSYGHIPPGYEKSVSEMEYDRASEAGIPRLVFTTNQEGPRETDDVETGEGIARLEAFIDQVKEKQSISQVDSVREFHSLLSARLIELGIRGEAQRGSSEHFTRDIRWFDPRKKGGGDAEAKAVVSEIPPKKDQKNVLRVFVASPRDVQDERSRMPKVVESLNRTLGKLLNVVVELWRWEVDAPPAVGEPQALIDPELDEADVVLVIFWNRFGTPTATGTTGTESEILRSLERWSKVRRPQLMIYFCQRPATLDRTELKQRLQLLDFRERISSLALALDYEEAEEFEWRVRDDLFTTIARLCVQPR